MRKLPLLEPGVVEALAGLEVACACTGCAAVRETLAVNSVRFDVLRDAGFLDAFERFVRCGRAHVVQFLAVHPTVVARQVPAYRSLLNSADLVVPDGAPVAALMRLRSPGVRRLTSTDGFLRMCAHGGLRHYFVGGSSSGVARSFQAELRRRFPSLEIVGADVPPFRPYTDVELKRLADAISSAGADVVWIGIGAPRQEILAHRLRTCEAAPVIACIGATFDFVAGAKVRAPAWVRALGLEWAFRLGQEPRRLWRRYLFGNARFVGAVAIDEVRRLRGRAQQGDGHEWSA